MVLLTTPSLFQGTLAISLSIVGEQDALVFVECFEVNGTTPELIDVLEGFLSIGQVEFLAFMEMLEVEFAIAPVIAVVHHDIRTPEVGHVGDNGITHLLPVLLGNNPLIALFLVEVEIE